MNFHSLEDRTAGYYRMLEVDDEFAAGTVDDNNYKTVGTGRSGEGLYRGKMALESALHEMDREHHKAQNPA